MTKGKKILYSIALVIIGLLVMEGVAFIGLQIVDSDRAPQPSKSIFHPLRHHAHRSLDVIKKDWPGLKTDQYGYIVTPGAPSHPSITIVLTGSSSARSPKPFISADLTLAAILQRKLNKKHGLNVEVKATAVAGYQAFREFMTAYEYFEHYNLKADLIISLNGLYSINKFAKQVIKNKHKGKIYDLYDENTNIQINEILEGSFVGSMRSLGQAILNLNLNTIQLLNRGLARMQAQSKKQKKPPLKENLDYRNDDSIDELYKRLFLREHTAYEMMRVLGKSHDSGFMLFLMPAKYSWLQLPPAEKQEDFAPMLGFMNRFYDDFKKHSSQYPITDLRDAFNHLTPEDRPYSEEEITHYNELGTNILAEKIMDSILPKLNQVAKNKLK